MTQKRKILRTPDVYQPDMRIDSAIFKKSSRAKKGILGVNACFSSCMSDPDKNIMLDLCKTSAPKYDLFKGESESTLFENEFFYTCFYESVKDYHAVEPKSLANTSTKVVKPKSSSKNTKGNRSTQTRIASKSGNASKIKLTALEKFNVSEIKKET